MVLLECHRPSRDPPNSVLQLFSPKAKLPALSHQNELLSRLNCSVGTHFGACWGRSGGWRDHDLCLSLLLLAQWYPQNTFLLLLQLPPSSHGNVPDLSLHRLGSSLRCKALTSKLDRFSISSEGRMSYKLLCWDAAHAVPSRFNNLNDLARTSAPGIVSPWRALGLRWDGEWLGVAGWLWADTGRVLGHKD